MVQASVAEIQRPIKPVPWLRSLLSVFEPVCAISKTEKVRWNTVYGIAASSVNQPFSLMHLENRGYFVATGVIG
jgi:hypothetical protein